MGRRSRGSSSDRSSSRSSSSSSGGSDYEEARSARAAMAYAHHMRRAHGGARATHHKGMALSYLAFGADVVPYVVDLDADSELQGEPLPVDYVDPTPFSLDMRELVDQDRLVFYSGSRHGRVPGTSEIAAYPADYAELNRIADWRRTLSNFDVREFAWDGTGVLPVGTFPRGARWNTIEHAYHASKYEVVASRCADEGRAHLLRRVAATLMKGADAAATAAAAAAAGAAAAADAAAGPTTKRRKVPLTDAYVDTLPFIGDGTGAEAKKRGRDVVLDKRELGAWDDVSRDVMGSIARAKFLGNRELQRVLLATRDARLYHLLARVTSVNDANLDRFTHLERIRDELKR